jgi:hypothetical protein
MRVGIGRGQEKKPEADEYGSQEGYAEAVSVFVG